MSTFNFLPLFDVGMAWLLPTLVAMVVAKFVGARDSALAEA